MPFELPLSIVVVEVVRRTPTWAWAVLAALVVLGSLQLRDHEQSRARLLMMPAALAAWSLWSAAALFGAGAAVLAAWLGGAALALVVGRAPQRRPAVRANAAGGIAVRGSVLPLLLMLGVFAVRYVVAVTLVFHPGWRALWPFALAASAVYGLLSGLFAARALRLLGATPAPRLGTA
jgi:uncharacterized integral membrane protein